MSGSHPISRRSSTDYQGAEHEPSLATADATSGGRPRPQRHLEARPVHPSERRAWMGSHHDIRCGVDERRRVDPRGEAVIRRAPRPLTNWTMIRNEVIADPELSFKATGVLIYILVIF